MSMREELYRNQRNEAMDALEKLMEETSACGICANCHCGECTLEQTGEEWECLPVWVGRGRKGKRNNEATDL